MGAHCHCLGRVRLGTRPLEFTHWLFYLNERRCPTITALISDGRQA
jgi:hypothetical protein